MALNGKGNPQQTCLTKVLTACGLVLISGPQIDEICASHFSYKLCNMLSLLFQKPDSPSIHCFSLAPLTEAATNYRKSPNGSSGIAHLLSPRTHPFPYGPGANATSSLAIIDNVALFEGMASSLSARKRRQI